MARMCGVLKIALREDDPGQCLRLAAEDIAGEVGADGKPIEPGLYFAGQDAVDRFAPRVLARLKKAGVLPESATLASVGYKLLM